MSDGVESICITDRCPSEPIEMKMYDRPLSYYKEQRKGTPLVFFADSPVKLNRIINNGNFFPEGA